MKTKVLQVFYNENGLPFKDQERTVHFPVIGSGFMGASNTTQIRFYFKEIGDDAVKYVAVSKLPNGKVGSKVLENYYDSELDEPYALLELDSYYTQYKGDLFISLQGYQGGVQVTYDEDTELYEIEGTPTIQATGSIKFTNNYATQFVGSGEEQNITLQQLLAIISDTVLRYYVTSSNTLAEVFNEIGTKICAIDIEGDEYLCEMSGNTNIVLYDIHNQEWYAFTGANTTTIDSVLQDSNKQIIATKEDLENFGNLFLFKGDATVAEINALTDIGNGWAYNLKDSGTLTLGNLQVEQGDNVAFNGTIWVKLSSETVLGQYYTKEEGQELETQVDNRLTSMENQVQQVAQGSPKGVYATLSDLETAYPTGAEGIYVVSANGHWYYWNGSAWADGGLYLSDANYDQLLELYNSPFVDFSNRPSYIKGIIGLKFKRTDVTSYGFRLRYYAFKASSYYLFLQIQYKSSQDTDTWETYTNLEIALSSSPTDETGILKLSNTAIEVLIVPSIMETHNLAQLSPAPALTDNSDTYFYKNLETTYSIEQKISTINSQISSIDVQLGLVDTPFKDTIPSTMRGIIAFQLYSDETLQLKDFTKFKVAQIYFGHSSLYLHISLQGYKNGSWIYYDSVSISQPYTPTSDVLVVEGQYKRMKVVVIPSLMGNISQSSSSYELKNTSINRFIDGINEQFNNQTLINQYEDFAIMDRPKHIVVVDANGNGDYTTIGAAYAAITDSSYENQYEIQVLPGTYNEYNLVPPIFTHTHGLHPNTVTVTGVGISQKELSIFDLTHTCKLSNMTIIGNAVLNDNGSSANQNRYCIHFDSGDGNRLVICTNLKVIKVYNATSENPYGDNVRNRAYSTTWSRYVVGMGTGHHTTRIDFNSCDFINGVFVSHTNPNLDTDSNGVINIKNCSFCNSYIELETLENGETYSTQGKYVCNIENCNFETARVANSKNLTISFWTNNKPWTIIGGRNNNLVVGYVPKGGATGEAIECLNSTEVGFINLANNVSTTKGKWVDVYGNVANNPTKEELFGCALENKDANDATPIKCWVGNAYPYGGTDGLYGIINGSISNSATNKILRIINGVVYRL